MGKSKGWGHPKPRQALRPGPAFWAIIAITVAGLGLRLYAIDHGLPYQYVPDESTMVGGALRMGATRSLQPSTFIYPAGLMYVFASEYLGLLVVGRLTGLFASVEQFREFAFIDPSLFYLLPRIAVALAGTATIPFSFLLGRRLYGIAAGLFSAGLIAASLMHVQMSHQARHWVPVTLFALVVLWVSLDLAERGRRRDYRVAGLLVGLAAATSYNGFLLALMPLIAHGLHLRKRGLGLTAWRSHLPALESLALAPVIFFLLNPYILLQADRFVAFHTQGDASIGGQILGHYDNYLQQFLDKQGLTFFGWASLSYEPAITILGIVGAVMAARRFRGTAALVLSYPLFHYLMFSTTAPSLEQRYMLTGLAVWALPAGLAGATGISWFQKHVGGTRAVAATAVLVALVLLPTMRYDWLLSRPDTRTLAKEWIESSIPAGSDLAVESYPPPLTPDLASLQAQQQAEPRSLGARDQWILDNGFPPAEVGYRLARLNLIDTSPAVDFLSPYLETSSHRYFVVSDYRWKSDHRGHQALKSYLTTNGQLIALFPPAPAGDYVPSDVLNNMEDPLTELWKIDRPGPAIAVYEVDR